MSLYLDTTCFLKLLFSEPETLRVVHLTSNESQVVVSALTRIETLVQISGREADGFLTRRDGTAVRRALATLLNTPPFEAAESPPQVIPIAEQQVRAASRRGHCRTLDRLHLATMEALGLRRLLTNDTQQAEAGRALGFDVVLPH